MVRRELLEMEVTMKVIEITVDGSANLLVIWTETADLVAVEETVIDTIVEETGIEIGNVIGTTTEVKIADHVVVVVGKENLKIGSYAIGNGITEKIVQIGMRGTPVFVIKNLKNGKDVKHKVARGVLITLRLCNVDSERSPNGAVIGASGSEIIGYKSQPPNNTIMIRGLAQHITENDVSSRCFLYLH